MLLKISELRRSSAKIPRSAAGAVELFPSRLGFLRGVAGVEAGTRLAAPMEGEGGTAMDAVDDGGRRKSPSFSKENER